MTYEEKRAARALRQAYANMNESNRLFAEEVAKQRERLDRVHASGKAEWLFPGFPGDIECSACKGLAERGYPFCPWCGRPMWNTSEEPKA